MKQLTNIGLGLAIAFLICLFPMPYGYYTLIRFAVMIYFACLAFAFYGSNKEALAVISGALAILFQPFIKIALGRDMWNVVDVIVALALIVLWLKQRKETKE